MLNILYSRTNRHIEKEFGPKNGPNVNSLRTDFGSDSGLTVDGTQGCRLRARISLGTRISSGALHTKGCQHILVCSSASFCPVPFELTTPSE